MTEWITVEQLCEYFWGPDWRNTPEYIEAREWARGEFYGGGPMPSDPDGERQGDENAKLQAVVDAVTGGDYLLARNLIAALKEADDE